MSRAKLKHNTEEHNTHAGRAAHGRAKIERLKMTEEIVRCHYCVLDDHFRPMLSKPEGWFICSKCGHSTIPDKPDFKCFCQKCGELNRAA